MHKRISRAIIALLALAVLTSTLSPIVLAEDTVELYQNDNVIIDIDIYDPHDIDEVAESSEFDVIRHGEERLEPLNLNTVLTRGRGATYIVMSREPTLSTIGNIPNMPFRDVPINDWAHNMIAWAWQRGWVTGRTPTTFVPHAYMTREEFTAMVVRAFNIPPSNVIPPFIDWNSVSAWARPYVRSAHARGLIRGFPDGTFRPRNHITRRDAITITQRAGGREITDPVPRAISWNAQGGTGGTSWSRIPGHAIGGPLPRVTWGGRTFRGWSTTNDRYTRGSQVTVNTRVLAGSGTVNKFARWHDPIPRDNNHNGRRHMLRWYRSSSVTLAPTNFVSPWQIALDDAMRNWRNSATSITVNYMRNSNNFAFVRHENADDLMVLGSFLRRAYSGTTLTRFDIWIYSESINTHARNNGFQARDVATSVWVHEIGHAVGLADNPSDARGNNSIMCYRRSRNIVWLPQAFDRQSVNWLYG